MGRAKALSAITVVAALVVAGCGGGGSSSTSTGASSADIQQFQSCLRQHGLNLPSGGSPPSGRRPPSGGGFPGGVGGAKAQRAFQACQQYMPAPPGGASGGFPGAPPGSGG